MNFSFASFRVSKGMDIGITEYAIKYSVNLIEFREFEN